MLKILSGTRPAVCMRLRSFRKLRTKFEDRAAVYVGKTEYGEKIVVVVSERSLFWATAKTYGEAGSRALDSPPLVVRGRGQIKRQMVLRALRLAVI